MKISIEQLYKAMEEFYVPVESLKEMKAYLVKKTWDDEFLASRDWSLEDIGEYEVVQIEGNFFLIERKQDDQWGDYVEGKRIDVETARRLARRC